MSLEFLLMPEVIDTALGFGLGTAFGYAVGEKESVLDVMEKTAEIAHMEGRGFEKLFKGSRRRLQFLPTAAAFGSALPAVVDNAIRGDYGPRFAKVCTLSMLAGFPGYLLGRFFSRRKHRRMRQRIDDIVEKAKKMMIEGRNNLKVHEAFERQTWDEANKSRYHEMYKTYSLAKFKQAAEYAYAYREVKDFMLVVPTPFFGAAVIGEPKYQRCYIILMELGNITTANAGIKRLKAIRNDELSVTCITPKVELENTVEWDSTPEPVVDLIMANRKERGIVLAGGAEYMPREERLSSAAAGFANSHYLWTQNQGEGSGGKPNAS